MGRMVRKQVYIEDRQDGLLKAEAARSGRTESELIRDEIDRVYDRDAEDRRLADLWREWEASSERLAEEVARAGGIGSWRRDDAHRRAAH